MNQGESYIEKEGINNYSKQFNEQGMNLLEKYDKMADTLNNSSGIKGVTKESLNEASAKVNEIRSKLEGILLKYNAYMGEAVEGMAGVDAEGVAD